MNDKVNAAARLGIAMGNAVTASERLTRTLTQLAGAIHSAFEPGEDFISCCPGEHTYGPGCLKERPGARLSSLPPPDPNHDQITQALDWFRLLIDEAFLQHLINDSEQAKIIELHTALYAELDRVEQR